MRFSTPRSILCASLLLALFTSFTAPDLHARLKKARKKADASRPSGPLVFRSRGTVDGGGKVRQRDRTITMTRSGASVAVRIDDHVDNQVLRGTIGLTPERQLVTDDPALMNAANLIAITPRVLARLKAGEESVETFGQVEANGKVHSVVMAHSLVGAAGATTSEVLTVTESENGKLSLETRAVVDAQGIPVSATTTGRLKVFVFSADINLTLERVSGHSL